MVRIPTVLLMLIMFTLASFTATASSAGSIPPMTESEHRDLLKQCRNRVPNAYQTTCAAVINDRRIPLNRLRDCARKYDAYYDAIVSKKRTLEEIKQIARFAPCYITLRKAGYKLPF